MLEVREIRVNTTTREVSVFAPNGHPVDPCPWLTIATKDPLEPGFHWMSEREVSGPEWQGLDWLALPVPYRLADLLTPSSSVDEGNTHDGR